MNLLPASSSTSRAIATARLLAVAALLGGAAVGALAQYKIVGPDGRVTYTDKPPTASEIRPGNAPDASAPSATGGLPYETRQAMGRYPVTLYASTKCPACDSVRGWLKSHGVPFTEYALSNDNDFRTLQSRFGDTSVPVTTIGSQRLKAFNPTELQSYLDAAGYPKQVQLVGYRWPAPVPLTSPRNNPPPAATADAEASSAPAGPVLPPPATNGIQF